MSGAAPDARSRFGRALREPTLLFAFGAAALFALNWALAPRGPVVEVDRALVEWRILEAETLRGAPLTEVERAEIQNRVVEERILVREALALGLEKDDRVDDLLVQKMLHVLSGEVIQPTEAELAAFFAADSMRYAIPAAVTVEEFVALTQDALPDALLSQLREGIPLIEIETGLPRSGGVLYEVPLVDLGRIFDAATAEAAFSAEMGRWVGPYRSVRGAHWLRPVERIEAVPRPLEEVREEVRLDWIAEEEEARLARRVAELRERYTVVLTGGSEAR